MGAALIQTSSTILPSDAWVFLRTAGERCANRIFNLIRLLNVANEAEGRS